MLLVGHRGAAAYEPENTLRSFKKAFEFGANAIECDVHATKDKKIIVIHDPTLNRTTNGKGKIKEFIRNELQQYDAGKGEKIPTLQEVLSIAKGTVLVEIKGKGIEEEVEKIVRGKNIIVLSFNTETVRKIKQLNPDLQTGLLFSNKIKNLIGFFRLGKAIKADWLMGDYHVVDKKFIDKAHTWKFKILVWTVNSKTAMQKYAQWSIDGITSDKPDLFKWRGSCETLFLK